MQWRFVLHEKHALIKEYKKQSQEIMRNFHYLKDIVLDTVESCKS